MSLNSQEKITLSDLSSQDALTYLLNIGFLGMGRGRAGFPFTPIALIAFTHRSQTAFLKRIFVATRLLAFTQCLLIIHHGLWWLILMGSIGKKKFRVLCRSAKNIIYQPMLNDLALAMVHMSGGFLRC